MRDSWRLSVINKQRGYSVLTIPGLLVALSIVGIIAVYSLQETIEDNNNTLQTNVQSEITRLIKAHHACYDEERRWCTLAELQAAYITEDGAGVMGGGLLQALNVNGEDLDISFDAGTVNMALELRSKFPNTTVLGTRITSTIEPPTASHMFQSNIQRYADDEGFGRNIFEQDINVNNRLLNNISDFDGNDGAFVNLDAQNYNVDNMSVLDALNLGAVSLLFDINSMTLSATEIDINNGTMAGNINEIVGSLEGFNNADADTLQFNSLLSNVFDLSNASGNLIAFTNGNIQAAISQDTTVDTMTSNAATINGTNVVDGQGNISSTNASIDGLNADIVNGNNATITNVAADQVQSATSNIGNAITDTLNVNLSTTADALVVGSMNVTGNTSGDSFVSSTDFFTGLSSVNSNRNDVNTAETDADINRLNLIANATDLSSLDPRILANEGDIASNEASIILNSQNAALNNVNLGQNTALIVANTTDIAVNTENALTNEFSIDNNRIRLIANQTSISSNQSAIANNSTNVATLSSDVNSNLTNINNNTSTISANAADISNNALLASANAAEVFSNTTSITNNTGNIANNTISISNNSAQTAANQTSISANSGIIAINETNINTNQASISSNISGIAANQANINASLVDSNSNNSTILTNTGTINNNAVDISNTTASLSNSSSSLSALQDDLDECMFTTQYCIPQNPSVNLTCINCVQSNPTPTFSALAEGSITGCRQGCTYEWTVVGMNILSGCTNGAVPPSGSANPSCSIGSTVPSLNMANGQVTLRVSNTNYPGRQDIANVNVQFTNSSPVSPVVNLNCTNCNLIQTIGDFSSTSFNASISNCPTGCTYNWVVAGAASPLAGSCLSGSILSNLTASPTCNIEATVGPRSLEEGTVTLNVEPSGDPTNRISPTETYRFQNDGFDTIDFTTELSIVCSGTISSFGFGCEPNRADSPINFITLVPTIRGVTVDNWADIGCTDCVVVAREVPGSFNRTFDMRGDSFFSIRTILPNGSARVEANFPSFQARNTMTFEFVVTGQSQSRTFFVDVRIAGVNPP